MDRKQKQAKLRASTRRTAAGVADERQREKQARREKRRRDRRAR